MNNLRLPFAMSIMTLALAGCGSDNDNVANGTPPPTPNPIISVSSAAPQVATVGTNTTFTLNGQNLPNNLQITLANCQNITQVNAASQQVRFSCTPQVIGSQALTVRTAAGTTVFNGNINVLSEVVTTVINSVTPTTIQVGELAAFTVTGQNLPNNLQISLPQCQNISQISASATQMRFTCTPQTAGTQTLTIRNAAGVSLFTSAITIEVATPTPIPVPAQAFAGTWESTRCNEVPNGAFRLVLENHLISNNSFSFVMDSVSYTEPKCGGETRADFGHDGVGSGLIMENIGHAQRTNATTYYTASFKLRSTGSVTPGVLAFRDANTFCAIDGVAQNTDGAEIDRQIQSINLSTSNSCWKKSSLKRHQRLNANPIISTASYQFTDTQPTLVRLQEQLKAQTNSGYRLLQSSLETSSTSSTASLLLSADEREKRMLFAKNHAANATTYQYRAVDGNGETVTARFNVWKIQIRDQASQGYLYHSQQVVDIAQVTPNLYNNIYAKRAGDLGVYTISEQIVNSNTISATTWGTIANTMGNAGCRVFFAENILNGKYAYFCHNSSLHNGTYSYRWIAFPASPNHNAPEIKAILDAQKADGYLYRHEVELGNGTTGMMFERDSTQPNIGQTLEYKVFQEGATSRRSVAIIDENLSNQGLLGWHLWDGQMLFRDGDIFNSEISRTIYANHPQP